MEIVPLNYLRTLLLLKRKGIKYGKRPYIAGSMPILNNDGEFRVGDKFSMRNYQFKSEISCAEDAELIMGNLVGINQGSTIYAAESIRIGSNVLIGDRTTIYDTNFHQVEEDSIITRPVEIGDNAWIGVRTIILPGAKIGKNAVIGAGSLVTKSIPDDHLAVGSPAKVIKKIENPVVRSPRMDW